MWANELDHAFLTVLMRCGTSEEVEVSFGSTVRVADTVGDTSNSFMDMHSKERLICSCLVACECMNLQSSTLKVPDHLPHKGKNKVSSDSSCSIGEIKREREPTHHKDKHVLCYTWHLLFSLKGSLNFEEVVVHVSQINKANDLTIEFVINYAIFDFDLIKEYCNMLLDIL